MKNINYLFVLAIVVSCYACDTRIDFVNETNRPPKLLFNGVDANVAFLDSLKLGATSTVGGRTKEVIGDAAYMLEVSGIDPETALSQVSFVIQTGSAKIFLNDVEVTGGTIQLTGGTASVKITPQAEGLITIKFTVVDAIGKSTEGTFNLFSFKNLKPIAKLVLNPTKQTGPYEYEFNASGSYDADKNFGGVIRQYEYVINDKFDTPIKTDQKVIKHNFPGTGGYSVKYRVYDNEGAVSDFMTAPQITL